jgi:hypothetical protein
VDVHILCTTRLAGFMSKKRDGRDTMYPISAVEENKFVR